MIKELMGRSRRAATLGLASLLILVLGGYSIWSLRRPIPLLQPQVATQSRQIATPAAQLAWPTVGQSAISVVGTSISEAHGTQTPVPTASTAKVITALVVLDKKPIANGQTGPTITLSQPDVDLYHSYAAQDGSLVPVSAGEQITEYQMLQAMMLPSANNIADSLAIWAFGSLAAYNQAATAYLKQHAIVNTQVGSDASGFAPSTTSTATDLAKLGALAMLQPVLSQIVGQPTATGIPMTTIVKNVNVLLGTANIIGVKTGNTDQAGGVFISASRITVNNKPTTIITAVTASPGLGTALRDSLALVKSAQANFKPVTVLKAGAVVGHYNVPWGQSIDAIATDPVTPTVWNDSSVTAKLQLYPIKATDTSAGSVTVNGYSQKTSVTLKNAPGKPSVWWRLTHPHT